MADVKISTWSTDALILVMKRQILDIASDRGERPRATSEKRLHYRF